MNKFDKAVNEEFNKVVSKVKRTKLHNLIVDSFYDMIEDNDSLYKFDTSKIEDFINLSLNMIGYQNVSKKFKDKIYKECIDDVRSQFNNNIDCLKEEVDFCEEGIETNPTNKDREEADIIKYKKQIKQLEQLKNNCKKKKPVRKK